MSLHALGYLVFVRYIRKAEAQGVAATRFRLIAFRCSAGDRARRE
jgi:hypothetical protein